MKEYSATSSLRRSPIILLFAVCSILYPRSTSADTPQDPRSSLRITTDSFVRTLEIAPEQGSTITLIAPTQGSRKVGIEYTPTPAELTAVERVGKSAPTTIRVDFSAGPDGKLTIDKAKLAALGANSLIIQLATATVSHVAASDSCEKPMPMVILQQPPTASQPGLKSCVVLKSFAENNTLNAVSTAQFRATPKGVTQKGSEAVGVTVTDIRIDNVSWMAEPEATEQLVTTYYWEANQTTTTLIIDRKAIASTNDDSDIEKLALAIEEVCIELPQAWSSSIPQWRTTNKEMLYLALDSETQRARVRWKARTTGSGNKDHFCASLLDNGKVPAALKPILEAFQSQLAGGKEERLLIQYSANDSEFTEVARLIVPAVIGNAKFTDAIVLDDKGKLQSKFDVNRPITEWMRQICLLPDGIVANVFELPGQDLTIIDPANAVVLGFRDSLQFHRREGGDYKGYSCFDVPRAGDKATATGTGDPEDGLYVAYRGARLNREPLTARYFTGYTPKYAARRTFVAIGFESALRDNLRTEGLPSSSFVARAQMPLVGFSVGFPRKVSFAADTGVALSFRYASEKGDTLLGGSVGAYVGACLRIEVTTPVPQACGALGPTLVIGQQAALAGEDPKFGLDAQIGGIVVIGAGFN